MSYKSGYLVVRKEDDTVKIHLSEITSIVLQTMQVFISAYLLSELAKHKISLVVSDGKCNPIGQYLPLYGSHNTNKRITEQLEWGEPIKKRVWQHIVKDKIREQARLLEERGLDNQAASLYRLVLEVRSGDTTNREAVAARQYFAALFGERFSRDQESSINAALNYGYAILLSLTNREIVSHGHITQIGICHRSDFNPFNLSCDFMEPFRPAVDRLVLDNLESDFDSAVKRVLGDLENHGVAYKGGTYRLRSVLSQYVAQCLSILNRMTAVEDLEEFRLL